ncbi:hypothetical protein ACQY0O_000418 [Thecaphora frezii]
MSYYYCGNGIYSQDCNDGLSYGARAGIGVAIALVVIALCLLAGTLARRSRQRRFAAAHQQAMNSSHSPMAYGGGGPGTYGGYAQNQPYYGQPQAQSSPYAQAPYGNYAPPPPDAHHAETGDAGFYAPPPGPPPPAYQPRANENKV